MTNESLAHKWVYNEGRGSKANASNFSYEYDRLYSYSSLLAKIDRLNRVVLVDERIASYSSSSRKQAAHMRRAIPGYFKVIEYPFDQEPFEYYYNQIMNYIKKQQRARTSDYSYIIKKTIEQANNLFEYHKLENKKLKPNNFLKMIQQIDVNAIFESSKELIAKHQENLKRLKKLEDKAKQEQRQKSLDRFLDQVYDPKNKNTIKFNPNQPGVYIKYDEEKNMILTNTSIKVPVSEALLMYKAYLKNMKSIVGKKLENYIVIESKKDYVKIGCTVISSKELSRVMSKLLDDQ